MYRGFLFQARGIEAIVISGKKGGTDGSATGRLPGVPGAGGRLQRDVKQSWEKAVTGMANRFFTVSIV
jgi:hypothetical protein